jgi:hypothetical protein
MNGKQFVGRSVAIGLGIICIILAAGLIGVFAYYTVTINNQSVKYNDYVSTHSHADSDYNSLSTQLTNLSIIIQNQQNTIVSLNESLLNLEKPLLTGVGLKATDYGGAYTFQITGYVVNVGQTTAINCSLDAYLTVYEIGTQSPPIYTIVEKYIPLSTLLYGNSIFVNQNVSYSGGPLFGWSILPRWNGQTYPIAPILSS